MRFSRETSELIGSRIGYRCSDSRVLKNFDVVLEYEVETLGNDHMVNDLRRCFILQEDFDLYDAIGYIRDVHGPSTKAVWLATRHDVDEYCEGREPDEIKIPLNAIVVSDLYDEGALFLFPGPPVWAMTFSEYMKIVNPDNKSLDPKDRPQIRVGDLEGVDEGAKYFKTAGNITIRRDRFAFYAIVDKTVVGYAINLHDTIELGVVTEYQNRGIGRVLYQVLRRNYPFAVSGGYTEAGLRTEKSVYKQIVLDAIKDGKTVPINVRQQFFIKLRMGAEVTDSVTGEPVPMEIVRENELWAIDHYEPESGMYNVNRVSNPYPGAYCSWVHESDVVFV